MNPQPWTLDPTSQRIALHLLRRGPASRAELCRELDLSSASLTRLTRPMIARGLVRQGAPVAPATTGRPSLPLSLDADCARFVGVKIVPGALHVVLTDLRGTVLDSTTVTAELPTPQQAADEVAAVVEAWRKHRPVGVGISLGASVDADQTVSGAGFLGWGPSRLGDLVAEQLRLDVVVDNDVNALTVAEHWFGAGRELTDFQVLTVGMGIGLGVVCNDQMVPGHGGLAGMVDAMRLADASPAGSWLTTRAVCDRLGEALQQQVEPADVARAGADPRAGAVVRELARRLGNLVGQTSLVTAPQRVLVTGEGVGLVAAHHDEVVAGIHEVDPGNAVEVVLEELDFQEWARGSACLAIRAHMTR